MGNLGHKPPDRRARIAPVSTSVETSDVIVVGAGLAGLVAAAELADAGRRVLLVDQEPEQSLGGQAFWSFGGLFLVDTPRAAPDGHQGLARAGAAGLARAARVRPRRRTTGRAGGPRPTSTSRPARSAPGCARWGTGSFPIVGWAERGGGLADGHGNSVPRFHITWGTGPGVVEPFERRVRERRQRRLVTFGFRHQVDELIVEDGAVGRRARHGARARARSERGQAAAADGVGDFELRAQAVIVTSGGIGGNHDLVRENWPAAPRRAAEARWSPACRRTWTAGCSAITEAAGGSVINRDRMWHYAEGIRNWDPIWPNHGIRILPGPSSLWLDATGKRLPAPFFPGFDTLGTLDAPAHDRLRPLLVRADPEDHREGVRALRLGAEPRPHRQGRQAPAGRG